MLRVATVGGAHGLRGELRLAVHTDDPENRLARGAVLQTEPPAVGPLTIAAVSHRQNHWYVRFDGVADRTAAEGLRGVVLLAEPVDDEEEDAWYPHELAGLRAESPDGAHLGAVEGIRHLPAQDVLVLREVTGERTLIPFVRAIVPTVDLPGGRVVIDAPPGLLAGTEPEAGR
ncbi:ribosome maturation factor RimM [Occultella glacieicola]|uniref:Ribosome maturation factor RimM n=1 Tax=Occultella glacieicola TaxID=2518684 RepID=A0ABY2E1L3_9MICO|nr:ribosome maturation factor RimM [Occultella glacieicola]